jgi:hypothetical protein
MTRAACRGQLTLSGHPADPSGLTMDVLAGTLVT